jgi:hypothetical protein
MKNRFLNKIQTLQISNHALGANQRFSNTYAVSQQHAV